MAKRITPINGKHKKKVFVIKFCNKIIQPSSINVTRNSSTAKVDELNKDCLYQILLQSTIPKSKIPHHDSGSITLIDFFVSNGIECFDGVDSIQFCDREISKFSVLKSLEMRKELLSIK